MLVLTSCQTAKDHRIDQKNRCYRLKLNKLQDQILYKHVYKSFVDTFAIIQRMRNQKPLIEEKVDDAVFFKSDSLECLLLVLERHYKDSLSFGTARVYRGELFPTGWKFRASMWFSFDGYYAKYPNNSFENISEVARYAVLTNGKVDLSGCDIDEYFWFKHLKE